MKPSSLVLLAALPCLSLPLPPVPVCTDRIQHNGEAYGSFATVAGVAKAGRSFPVTLGTCGTLRTPATHRNTGATVNARPYATTGGIDTSVSATDVSGRQATQTTATIHSVDLLSGIITAREVKAVSTTSHDGAGFRTSAAGSSLLDLQVAGIPFLLVPAPNTRIALAGIGSVTLNEQVASVGPGSANLTVNMLHVFVTQVNPLVPVGTEIVVAHSNSGLSSTSITGTLDGFAYGTVALVGSAFFSGPSAAVVLGCRGTDGALRTNSIAGVGLTPHLITDVVSNTATGVANSTSSTGETTSTVEATSLLSSLVTADVIKADAHSFTDGSSFSFTDNGSAFVNLSVRGFPEIDDQVAPNTRLVIAGLGTLWLKHEIFTPNSIEVRMIQLVVDQANVYGLPIGSDIRVAVAHASAH